MAPIWQRQCRTQKTVPKRGWQWIPRFLFISYNQATHMFSPHSHNRYCNLSWDSESNVSSTRCLGQSSSGGPTARPHRTRLMGHIAFGQDPLTSQLLQLGRRTFKGSNPTFPTWNKQTWAYMSSKASKGITQETIAVIQHVNFIHCAFSLHMVEQRGKLTRSKLG